MDRAAYLLLVPLRQPARGLHNALLDLEELDDEQLALQLRRYEELAASARRRLHKGRLDTDSPEIKPEIARG